jgi:hypothetical protein
MNENSIEQIKYIAEKIMETTFPYCKDESPEIASINSAINNWAHKIKKLAETIKID